MSVTPSLHEIREELEAENFALRDKSQACDLRGARQLTEQIKASAVNTFLLLAEAHDRKAWKALNYASFGDYVRGELDISRSRAYQWLDLARIVGVIQEAADLSNALDISAREVAAVKGDVPALEAAVREATEGIDDEAERKRAAEAAVAAERHRREAEARTHQMGVDEIAPATEDASPPASEAPPETDPHGPIPVDERGGDPEPSKGEAAPQEPPRSPEPPGVADLLRDAIKPTPEEKEARFVRKQRETWSSVQKLTPKRIVDSEDQEGLAVWDSLAADSLAWGKEWQEYRRGMAIASMQKRAGGRR